LTNVGFALAWVFRRLEPILEHSHPRVTRAIQPEGLESEGLGPTEIRGQAVSDVQYFVFPEIRTQPKLSFLVCSFENFCRWLLCAHVFAAHEEVEALRQAHHRKNGLHRSSWCVRGDTHEQASLLCL